MLCLKWAKSAFVKISIHDSLRSLRQLKWVATFYYSVCEIGKLLSRVILIAFHRFTIMLGLVWYNVSNRCIECTTQRPKGQLNLNHAAIPAFNDLEIRAFENIMGKGENAVYQHFLLFP